MSTKNKTISLNLFSGETILQGMPELAYVFNKEGQLLSWNKNTEKVLGYSKKELYLKNVSDFQEINDRERVHKVFTDVLLNGEEKSVEYNMLTKSGQKIPCLGTGSLAIVDGKEYLIGIAINVSKLKNVEKKLTIQLAEMNRLKNQLQTENIYLQNVIEEVEFFENSIGKSEPLLKALYKIRQVAATETVVLLTGERDKEKTICKNHTQFKS